MSHCSIATPRVDIGSLFALRRETLDNLRLDTVAQEQDDAVLWSRIGGSRRPARTFHIRLSRMDDVRKPTLSWRGHNTCPSGNSSTKAAIAGDLSSSMMRRHRRLSLTNAFSCLTNTLSHTCITDHPFWNSVQVSTWKTAYLINLGSPLQNG